MFFCAAYTLAIIRRNSHCFSNATKQTTRFFNLYAPSRFVKGFDMKVLDRNIQANLCSIRHRQTGISGYTFVNEHSNKSAEKTVGLQGQEVLVEHGRRADHHVFGAVLKVAAAELAHLEIGQHPLHFAGRLADQPLRRRDVEDGPVWIVAFDERRRRSEGGRFAARDYCLNDSDAVLQPAQDRLPLKIVELEIPGNQVRLDVIDGQVGEGFGQQLFQVQLITVLLGPTDNVVTPPAPGLAGASRNAAHGPQIPIPSLLSVRRQPTLVAGRIEVPRGTELELLDQGRALAGRCLD